MNRQQLLRSVVALVFAPSAMKLLDAPVNPPVSSTAGIAGLGGGRRVEWLEDEIYPYAQEDKAFVTVTRGGQFFKPGDLLHDEITGERLIVTAIRGHEWDAVAAA